MLLSTKSQESPSTFFHPTNPKGVGGRRIMIDSGVRSRQKHRLAWTRERLLRERAIALGQSIDISTWKNYGSALNSYLTFFRIHNLPVEPTTDSLSFFTVFMLESSLVAGSSQELSMLPPAQLVT